VSLAFGWLAGGCAAPTGGSSVPKPGRGIAEYREVTHEARRAVAATVQSLEGLRIPSTQTSQTSAPPRALARFDRAFSQLELTSLKTRARAEAIIKRGQVYFEEWKENLSAVTNKPTVQAEAKDYTRLLDHFNRVRQRSGEVGAEFRPFMAKLREFRAGLDRVSNAGPSPASQGPLEEAITSGRRVEQTLDSAASALDAAEAELMALLATNR
jgi:hypothetical protein